MNIPDLSGINIVLLGAVTSFVATMVMQLKEYPKKIFDYISDRCVFKAYVYNYDQFYSIFEKWMSVNYPNSYRNVSVQATGTADNNKIESYEIRHEKNKIIIKKYGRYITIDKEKQRVEHATSLKDLFGDNYLIKGWFAKKEILLLIKEVFDSRNKYKNDGEVLIFCNDQWQFYESNKIFVKKLQDVYLEEDVKNVLAKDIDHFVNNSQWYNSRGIPYKRTFLFYGEPGNGKTSLALALAEYFKRDIFFLSINNFDNDGQLNSVFRSIKSDSILFIEDADKLFNDRNSEQHKISFSAFINCLDGCLYKRGLITIMTTNHIDRLDQALLREGRIDVKIEIRNPDKQIATAYVRKFYDDDTLKVSDVDMCMSKIQEICIMNKDNKEKAIETINFKSQYMLVPSDFGNPNADKEAK